MSNVPPIIANTDFQQWQGWQQVSDPSGQATYFVVPGYGGRYVYDPYASQATGRITIYENPAAVYEAAEEVRRQEEDANSAGSQLATVGGAVAGLGATKLVSNAVAAEKFSDSWLGQGYDAVFGGGGQAAQQTGNAASTVGQSANAAQGAGAAGAGGAGAAQSSLGAPEVVSVTRNSGEAASGAAGAGDAGVGTWAASNPYLGAAAGAAGVIGGGYGLYESYESGDEVGGALSGASLAAGASTLSAAMGYGALLGPWGIAAAAVIGAAIAAFGDRETGREIIQKRLTELKDEGVSVPDAMRRIAEYGASKGDLIQREKQKEQESGGLYGNSKFAESRDEADLRYTDTWGGLPWFESLGNQYLAGTERQRKRANEIALERGLFEEKRGQLYADGDALSDIWAEVQQDPELQDPTPVFERPNGEGTLPAPRLTTEVPPKEQAMDYRSREEMAQARTPQPGQAIQRPLTASNEQRGTLEMQAPQIPGWKGPQGLTGSLPEYYEGAPAGTYRAPDGINRITVGEDGQARQTLIGSNPWGGDSNNIPQIGEAGGIDAISQLLANKMDGNEPLGRGQQATIMPPQQVQPGGVGGPGYEPDPDRPGHYRRRR